METWCIEHPWMTFFLATIFIFALVDISSSIAIGMYVRNLKQNEKQSMEEGDEK